MANQNLTQEEMISEIYKATKKIEQYVIWMKVMSILKILIIVIPTILAIIYLPPFLKQTLEPYQELLNLNSQSKNILHNVQNNNFDINKFFQIDK